MPEFVVAEARPQTGKWRGTLLHPGDTLEMADLGRTYTLPEHPHCYFCEKPFLDGDRVLLWVRVTQELSTIQHEGCWPDEDSNVHSDDEGPVDV